MICNFMIFSESVGSGASLSAEEVKNMKLPVKHYFTGSLFFLNNRIM